MKKVVVVGLGQMGNLYVEKLMRLGIVPKHIIGIDIDPAKIVAAKEKFPGVTLLGHIDETAIHNPTSEPCDQIKCSIAGYVDTAIVATNTPSHHRVIIELMERGVKSILCEKPLGISADAVSEIQEVMNRTGAQVFTAFLMNFSLAILHVIKRMQDEGLIMTEGSAVRGKNRFGDSRPTPGDLKDETVHGAGILQNLCAVNQKIRRIDVLAQLTYSEYTSFEAQVKARALDPSFPMEVNASTMALEVITTDKGEVPCNLHSSFLLSSQTCRITAVLSRAHDPLQPVYSVEFNFDVKVDGKIIDKLMITTLDGNVIENLEFGADKLGDQTAAFLAAASGSEVDPRLTDFNEARNAVKFTEAALQSHKSKSMMTAYIAGS